MPVGYALYADACGYDCADISLPMPIQVFQGRQDTVVDPASVERWAASRPNVELHMLDDDHQLGGSLETIWAEAERFSSSEVTLGPYSEYRILRRHLIAKMPLTGNVDHRRSGRVVRSASSTPSIRYRQPAPRIAIARDRSGKRDVGVCLVYNPFGPPPSRDRDILS